VTNSRKIIGIFFGLDNLVIAQIEDKDLIDYYCIPYVLSPEEKETDLDNIDKNKLAAVLQRALKEKGIETKDVIVSLPISNIILRSFYMPTMPKDELDTAVKFEAQKYIPFRLENLTYDYQSFRVKEDKGKKIRIIFVGIKNELLEKYNFALEQLDLKVKFIEPSPVSLLRALIFKDKINQKQTQALVEVNSKGGSIIISDKGIPSFINDFKLPSITSEADKLKKDDLLAKLVNDIRLSIDYYQRHTPKTKVSSIVLCPEDIPQEVIDGLKEEVGIPFVSVEAKEILELEDSIRIGLLHAYGAGIRNFLPVDSTIDLNKKLAVTDKAELVMALRPKPLSPRQIKKVIQTGVIAGALVFVFFLFNLYQVSSIKSQTKNISKKQIAADSNLFSLSKKKLEKRLIEVKEKIRTFSGIKKEEALTPLLTGLAESLPDGVWLQSLTFNNVVKKNVKNLDITGFCYAENRSVQINAINQFVSNLKKNPLFLEEFKVIDVRFMTQKKIDEWLITGFAITCK